MHVSFLQILVIALALLLVLCSSGCGPSEVEEVAPVSAAVIETSDEMLKEDLAEETEKSAPISEDSEAWEEEANESVVESYEPPFPQRTNIFEAPQRSGRAMVQNSGEGRSAVELLGFVNVDGPRVVLSIDGLVASIAEGDQHDDIQVISIHPPAVVLQRGRQRWQASLDN